ncbi:hypothetical protein [Nonomuraea soli]|uniref:Nucleotidyltransferase family protein n=1 Tax=Nonomuraea soli TaxID=1032476 RepID=A0A7W0HUF1_9ACTN|nr:hypothetical protein [Nonomuraea soli]MBA2895721.1 hypothetical protein [Nonomuraea soli]
MNEDPLVRLRDAVARTRELVRNRAATGLHHEEADPAIGTIGTDSARGFDPFPLLEALHGHGARAVVIGQVAGIMHGSAELTGDLDLLWDGDPGQAAALAAAFVSVGAVLNDDDGAPVPCEPESFLRPKVQFTTAGASGDCCTPALPWGELRVAELLERAVVVAGGGIEVRYVAREDLIAMRRAVGRPKDVRRADELEALGAS